MKLLDFLVYGLQIAFVLWFVFSIKPSENETIFEKKTTSCLEGYFSIIVILAHIPLLPRTIPFNLVGTTTTISAVTLFSAFSSYGLTVSIQKNKEYIKRIPTKIPRLVVWLGIIHALHKFRWATGLAHMWLILLILNYCVFYLAYTCLEKYKGLVIIGFWVLMSLCMKFSSVRLFGYISGWGAHSLGFIFGFIVAHRKNRCVAFCRKHRWAKIVGFAMAFCCFEILYFHFYDIDGYVLTTYLAQVGISIVTVGLCLLLFLNFKMESKLMGWLGNIGLFTFLSHQLVIGFLQQYVQDALLIVIVIPTALLTASILAFVDKRIRSFTKRIIRK